MHAASPEFQNVGSDLAYAISYINLKREPIMEISLFRKSNVTDGKTFQSAESPEMSSAKFQHTLEKYQSSRGVQMVHVTLYRGGAHSNCAFESLLKSDFEMPANAVIGEPVGISNPRRRKAQDKQGRELETLWDSVDDIMFRALQADEEVGRSGRAGSTPALAITLTDSTPRVTVFDRIVRLANEHVGDMDMSRPISPD